MSEQQRHHRDAVGCAGQQSFYCSRAVEETLASCFDLPDGAGAVGVGGGCGQMTGGPIDVEDLASYYSFQSQPNQASLQTAQLNCCDYVQQQQHQQQPVQVPIAEVNQPYYNGPSLEEAAFAYCTDSRWMACPATSYCPLYDVSQQPLESWHVLPCAQDFCGYYTAEDDILEEYLYVQVQVHCFFA